MIIVKRFQDGLASQNAYVIRDKDKAIVIDPGFNGQAIASFLEEKHLHLEAVLLTHAHFDHIRDLTILESFGPMPLYLHELEVPSLKDDFRNYASHFNKSFHLGKNYQIHPFSSDGNLDIPSFVIHATFTPGHTKGAVIYKIENHLFTGDTLFKDSVGRTDLFGGDGSKLKQSLKIIKERFSKQSFVHPGHNDEGVLGDILLINPYMKNS